MGRKPPYSTWVEVDLESIQGNVNYIRKTTGAEVMAVVKANAYGHGAVPVAKAALAGGATWCAVARSSEVVELRDAGLECPILILGYIPKEQVAEMLQLKVSLTVWTLDDIKKIGEQARKLDVQAPVHLKIETGMGRLGSFPSQALDVALAAKRHAHIQLQGVFSHLARADENDPEPTENQEKKFEYALSLLKDKGIQTPYIHLANSAASLKRPSAHYNLVRPGISIYGLPPSPAVPLPDDFQRALTWKTVLANVKTLPPGHGVSYGHEYVTQEQETIGALPLGYADGYRRTDGNQVLIHGQRIPVIGRVCMDQCMIKLDHIHNPQIEDEVVLIGKQGEKEITADEVGRIWGTINYEVTCAIGPRVPRLYPKSSM